LAPTGLFDAVLNEAGIQVVLSWVQMPRMNPVMERWVQASRHELLDRTLSGISVTSCMRYGNSSTSTTSTGPAGPSGLPHPCSATRTDYRSERAGLSWLREAMPSLG